MKHFLSTILILFVTTFLWVGCNNSDKSKENTLNNSQTYHLKQSPIGKELVEAEVGFISPAFKANGRLNIEYELAIVNNFKKNLVLNSIEIINADSLRTIVNYYDSNYLKDNFLQLGVKDIGDGVILESGRKGNCSAQAFL